MHPVIWPILFILPFYLILSIIELGWLICSILPILPFHFIIFAISILILYITFVIFYRMTGRCSTSTWNYSITIIYQDDRKIFDFDIADLETTYIYFNRFHVLASLSFIRMTGSCSTLTLLTLNGESSSTSGPRAVASLSSRLNPQTIWSLLSPSTYHQGLSPVCIQGWLIRITSNSLSW